MPGTFFTFQGLSGDEARVFAERFGSSYDYVLGRCWSALPDGWSVDTVAVCEGGELRVFVCAGSRCIACLCFAGSGVFVRMVPGHCLSELDWEALMAYVAGVLA
jgi:hypothetical protein